MVLIEEVADVGWGIGDQILTLAMLAGNESVSPTPDANHGYLALSLKFEFRHK